MKNRLKQNLLIGLLVVFTTPAMAAGDAENFKQVMQRISVKMASLIDPIMTAEFDKVYEIAEHVANHDEPPLSHRLKIIAELGADFTGFKKYDDEVHINSVAIQTSAKNKDVDGMILNYGKTLQSCNGCHKKFRERIRKINF